MKDILFGFTNAFVNISEQQNANENANAYEFHPDDHFFLHLDIL